MTLTLILAIGCKPSDERLIELSQQSLARQAEQNEAMARQTEQIAEASKQLVQADAKARQELIAAQSQLHEKLQAERSSLDRQHEALETERKQLAAQRQRDPILAAAIMHLGILLACLLPLVVCIFLLRAVKDSPSEGELCAILVDELVAPDSQLRLPLAPDDPQAAQDPLPAPFSPDEP